MKKLLTLCIIMLTIQAYGQKIYTDLYGFRLGQYREAAKNELGIPFQSGKYDDGFEYEVYLLKPDTSLYITFEYAANKTDIIWSIQVSGSNSTIDIGFQNIKLGIDKSQLKKAFGKPTTNEDIGEYGHQWSYDNFSFEVNPKGKLTSVKILDNSNELFATPDFNKIPSFDKIQMTLNSNNNSDILNLLSGDIEVYKNDSTYNFKKSFKTEEATDYSKIISLIKAISKDLSTVNTKNADEYEENMRFTYGEDTKHVIKIKKGHMIKEIVLKYYFGQYVIWEIKT
ncbi:MAG: hypothetical protein WC868_12900 [Bacteroidales bacterium]